jgi:hypothetical protein
MEHANEFWGRNWTRYGSLRSLRLGG